MFSPHNSATVNPPARYGAGTMTLLIFIALVIAIGWTFAQEGRHQSAMNTETQDGDL